MLGLNDARRNDDAGGTHRTERKADLFFRRKLAPRVALGLTDRVDNAAAISALSAIAGYVLGTIGSIRPPTR